MEKKKSSIDWLVQELNNNIDFIPNVHHWDKIRNIIQQAKAMHKEEIIDSWYNCKMSVIEKNPTTADQYYEQTFGGQDNE